MANTALIKSPVSIEHHKKVKYEANARMETTAMVNKQLSNVFSAAPCPNPIPNVLTGCPISQPAAQCTTNYQFV